MTLIHAPSNLYLKLNLLHDYTKIWCVYIYMIIVFVLTILLQFFFTNLIYTTVIIPIGSAACVYVFRQNYY